MVCESAAEELLVSICFSAPLCPPEAARLVVAHPLHDVVQGRGVEGVVEVHHQRLLQRVAVAQDRREVFQVKRRRPAGGADENVGPHPDPRRDDGRDDPHRVRAVLGRRVLLIIIIIIRRRVEQHGAGQP